MLYFNVKHIFRARQIDNPYTYLVRAGFSAHAAAKITGQNARVLRLDHIERLCEILHCQPNDLITYAPGSNRKLPKEHPLQDLLYKETNLEWKEVLKTMPLSQLEEISKLITATQSSNQE